MSKDNKIRMPTSGGGLVNYYEDSRSKIKFKPAHIIIFVFAVILIWFMLQNYGYSLLGIA